MSFSSVFVLKILILLKVNILSLFAEVLQITKPTRSCCLKVRLYIVGV